VQCLPGTSKCSEVVLLGSSTFSREYDTYKRSWLVNITHAPIKSVRVRVRVRVTYKRCWLVNITNAPIKVFTDMAI
jgi:hypothetical protein